MILPFKLSLENKTKKHPFTGCFFFQWFKRWPTLEEYLIKIKFTNSNKTPETRIMFDVFWEYISKAFNTKYHEGTKDEKN
jgi:hypothetical protein